MSPVRGEAISTSSKVWLIFAENKSFLFSTIFTILRAIRVLRLNLKETLFAVGSEGLFLGKLKGVREAAFGALHRYVHKLMCFVLSIALRAQSNKWIFRAVYDAVGHATVATLSHGRIAVGVNGMLSEAVHTVTIDHFQQ
jgi:hypothetical protein